MDTVTPRYKHDCDSCVYLGQFGEYDLYFADHGGISTEYSLRNATVLARWSDHPCDYSSGICFANGMSQELTEALSRATARGMIHRVTVGMSALERSTVVSVANEPDGSVVVTLREARRPNGDLIAPAGKARFYPAPIIANYSQGYFDWLPYWMEQSEEQLYEVYGEYTPLHHDPETRTIRRAD